jgi:hypothetical protein
VASLKSSMPDLGTVYPPRDFVPARSASCDASLGHWRMWFINQFPSRFAPSNVDVSIPFVDRCLGKPVRWRYHARLLYDLPGMHLPTLFSIRTKPPVLLPIRTVRVTTRFEKLWRCRFLMLRRYRHKLFCMTQVQFVC